MFNIALDFLEDRQKNLKFDRKSLAMIRGKDYIGDLARIQKEFLAIGQNRSPTSDKLLTSSPLSLLHQVIKPKCQLEGHIANTVNWTIVIFQYLSGLDDDFLG